MWKFLAAVLVALVPFSSFAQNQPAQPTVADADQGGLGKTLAITAGVVGGVVVADLLTGGALTNSVLTVVGLRQAAPAAVAAVRPVLTPAIQEARAAGAVLGEQIVPATLARDTAARSELAYAGLIGLGGIVGGWIVSHFTH